MRRRVNRSDTPDKISEVMAKLQQAQRELERLQYTEHGGQEPIALSDDKMLKAAKSLLFIWNSRNSFLDQTLIADPGWLILLNLKIAEIEHSNIQVSTLCIDSGAPATTALRWIKLLESRLLVKVVPDVLDGRRKFVSLTKDGSDLIGRYIQNIRNFANTKEITF